ncbi:MAG: hypothetical protein EKK54_05600 [Neisseriaceae bacterium]|nr:MAG: hypothetical protein EKK54_05600 [Neisseriaceae bacterium]
MKKSLFLLTCVLAVGCTKSADKFVGTWVNDDCGKDFPVKIFKDGDAYKLSYENVQARLLGQKNPKPVQKTLSVVDDKNLVIDGSGGMGVIKMVKDNEMFMNWFGCSNSSNYHKINN